MSPPPGVALPSPQADPAPRTLTVLRAGAAVYGLWFVPSVADPWVGLGYAAALDAVASPAVARSIAAVTAEAAFYVGYVRR